jgi:hypothetical protein
MIIMIPLILKARVSLVKLVYPWVCLPTLSSAVSSRVRYNRGLSRMSLVCYHHHHYHHIIAILIIIIIMILLILKARVSLVKLVYPWVCLPTLSSAVSSRVRYIRGLSRMSLVCYHHHHYHHIIAILIIIIMILLILKARVSLVKLVYPWVCLPTLSSAVSSRVRYIRSLSRMSLLFYHHHHYHHSTLESSGYSSS